MKVRLLLIALCVAVSTIAIAREGGEQPCIDCTMYDYGWQFAESEGLSSPSECDFEILDSDDREFVRGCNGYLKWKAARR